MCRREREGAGGMRRRYENNEKEGGKTLGMKFM